MDKQSWTCIGAKGQLRRHRWVPFLLVAFWVGACGGPRLQQLAPLPPTTCRLAVLPFINETRYQEGDLVFSRILASELLEHGRFRLAQEGDVRRIYRQMRIAARDAPTMNQLQVLGERLEADILIDGRIVEMEENSRASGGTPLLAVSIRMVDGATGKELVRTFHRRYGAEYRKIMDFGLIHSMTGLAKRVSSEILKEWQEEGLLTCED